MSEAPPLKICATIAEARAACREVRAAGRRLGLVPTMGALHEGHLSLVRIAREQCDVVAVSIFVNPTQFGPTEDFAEYPRTFEADCTALEKENVEIVFAPSAEEMYKAGETTWITVESLCDKLDGLSRPGHFRGVTTVVSKLFHILEPDAAYFGQKDAAQLAVIRRMVRDLNFPMEIVGCPTIRESDGLAMSSRNAYLSPEDRRRALVLNGALRCVEREFGAGQRDVARLRDAGYTILTRDPEVHLDYFAIVDPNTLDPVASIQEPALAAVAAYIGPTRLIDNILLIP